MVSFGQRILPLGGPHSGRSTPGSGVHTARLSEMSPVAGPQRASSHVIMLVSTGQGTHTLDFVTHVCRPGTLLWGRPGQVHHFGRQPGLDATLIAFEPGTLPDMPELSALQYLVDDPFAVTCWQPAGEDEEAIVADVAQIAVDIARYGGNRLGGALLAHELAVLLVRIAALAPPAARGPAAEVLGQLRAALEREVVHRRVEDYAELLGCSVRTLTRASLAATGRSAKQLIDERVALEAKRLLATTDLPVADVGRLLGFDEPTNFGRFFAREAGLTPGGFRVAAWAAPPTQPPMQRSALPGRLGRPGL
jgi:AraC-like DNA-binding protein